MTDDEKTFGQMLAERIALVPVLQAENERLREAIRRLADQDATLAVQGGNVIVTMDATLTAEERAAVEWSINDQIEGGHEDHPIVKEVIVTLRKLLERTK